MAGSISEKRFIQFGRADQERIYDLGWVLNHGNTVDGSVAVTQAEKELIRFVKELAATIEKRQTTQT